MRLMCDEMLQRLGKWLRAAGYDTAIAARGDPDERVVDIAVREDRLLLTCDKRMLPLLEAAPLAWLMLESSKAADAVPVVERVLGIDMRPPHRWSRCLKCNVKLEDLARADLPAAWEGRVPAGKDLYCCPSCDQVFWEGSHVRRLDERLRVISSVGPAT